MFVDTYCIQIYALICNLPQSKTNGSKISWDRNAIKSKNQVASRFLTIVLRGMAVQINIRAKKNKIATNFLKEKKNTKDSLTVFRLACRVCNVYFWVIFLIRANRIEDADY